MRIFIAIALCCLVKVCCGFFGYTRKFNNHDEPFIPHTNRFYFPGPKRVHEKWIEQPLDHFNQQENRRWMMRYLENNVHFQPGGPIMINVGGEWTITAGAISHGSHIFDLAKELNGTLYYTEHRYYGQSHPTENTSTENLRYLSVDQALADLAVFIDSIKASSLEFKDSGVILVGGSYSATMVAWMRKKYPHLVTGAWASSAPVNSEVDFFKYKEVMTNAIRKVGGDECSATIENAFKEMERLVAEDDVERLLVAFNLCSSLDLSSDVAHFFYEISDIVAGLVQSHRVGRIEAACEVMRRKKQDESKEDLEAFGAWVNQGLGSPCLDMKYTNNVEKFRNVEWGSEANRQMRQWTYQTCSEFAWFQTSTSTNQIFGSPSTYPVDYFVQLCKDLYDFSFNMTTIERNVLRSNIRRGGFNLAVTNVYFTHGELDPWHPNGVLEDLNESSPVTILPLSSHVSDLGQIVSYDSSEMIASKKKVRQLVFKWLNVPLPDDENVNKIP